MGDRCTALEESLRKMEEAEKHAELTVKRMLKMGRENLSLEDEEAEREGRMKLLKQTTDVDEEKIRDKYDDEDEDGDEDGGGK